MSFLNLITDLKLGEKPTLDRFIEVLSPYFGLILELKNTPQDSIWHQEGSVYTHTAHVLSAAYELIENEDSSLTIDEKLTFILSAVLHDIAKPICTKTQLIDDKERIVAPHHEQKGAAYLSYKILSLNLDYKIIQNILRLIANHHIPKKLILKNKDKGEFYRLARICNSKLLYLLIKADILGRICPDQQHQLDIVELFKLQLEELNLFNNRDPYESWDKFYKNNHPNLSPLSKESLCSYAKTDFEAGLIFTKEEAVAKRYPYLKSFSHLIIMCGPSGAGKSHFINKHFKNYHLISLDLIRKELFGDIQCQKNNRLVLQKAKERLKEALRQKYNIVWDATCLKKDFRSQLFNLGHNYNAFVTLIVLHTPLEVLYKQNKNRRTKVNPITLQNQLEELQWPSDDEAHRTIFICDDITYAHNQSNSSAEPIIFC